MREIIGEGDPWRMVEEAHSANSEVGKIKLFDALGLQANYDMPANDRGPQGATDMLAFALTGAEIKFLESIKMLVPGLIPNAHIINFVAPAGAGKTTIAMHLCREMAGRGISVWYVNADSAPDAAKSYLESVNGLDNFLLILPDFKGVSMAEIQNALTAYIDRKESLENTVIVFDTLKKAVDMMSKRGLREFYKWGRKLSALGATVILLGHTNKHTGPDGRLIFEGTGDIRNDTDELFYLESVEQDDGSQIVTMRPDKTRAFEIRPATFTIHTDRTVTRNDSVIDTATMLAAQETRVKDAGTIEAILDAINDLARKGAEPIQNRIVAALKGRINHKTIRRVIAQQDGVAWQIERGIKNSQIVRPLL